MMRLALTSTLLMAVLVQGQAPLNAGEHGEADLTEEILEAEASAEKSSSQDLEVDTSTPSATLSTPYVVKRVSDYYLDQPCGDEPDHVIASVRYVEIDPATEQERVLHDTYECLPIPWGDDPGDFDQELPAPRIEDIRDAVSRALPRPMLAANPHPEGLTGLETHLWYGDDGASQLEDIDTGDGTTRPGLSVTATAGPYEITAVAWISEYRWQTGDGASYTSSRPGSREDPAATHTYETKGDYTVVTETVWVGSYTWTVGAASGSGDLGSVALTTAHEYPVVEARSVLTR